MRRTRGSRGQMMYRYEVTAQVHHDIGRLVYLRDRYAPNAPGAHGTTAIPLQPPASPPDPSLATRATWDVELVLQVHERLLREAGMAGDPPGFRRSTCPVLDEVSLAPVYTPPPAHMVPSLVSDLAGWAHEWARERSGTGLRPARHPTPKALRQGAARHAHSLPASTAPLVAALLHIRLMGIRPFKHANHRTAHVLAALAMYHGGFASPLFTTVEEWWQRHPETYATAIACVGTRWNPEADVTIFLEMHARAHVEHATALLTRRLVEDHVQSALAMVVTRVLGAEPRVTAALMAVLQGEEMTNRRHRELTGVSIATATNDLSHLDCSGVLAGRGAGRSRRYVPTARLLELAAAEMGLDPQVIRTAQTLDEARGALFAHAYGQLQRAGALPGS